MRPIDWLGTLGSEIIDRRPVLSRWDRYYHGDHDLPRGPQQHKDAYRQFQKRARTNLCRLCVDSMVHRMKVIGYSSGEDEDRTENEVWRLWQASRLDSRQFSLYRKSLCHGSAFIVVGTDPRRPNRSLTTVESAHNIAVAYDSSDQTYRLAAVRLWYEKVAGRFYATVFTPGTRTGYQTQKMAENDPLIDWTDRKWELRYEPARSFDRIPVIEYPNGDDKRAEFDVAIDVQDRMNLTLLNRMTSERYSAFRKQYLTNYEPEYDEVTGLPLNPFKSGADQLFIVPPPAPGMPEPRFGDLAQTDTAGMLRAVADDMKAFAAVSITPVYYLPGDLINVSAEGISALDAGHIAKIHERIMSWSESHEEVLAMLAEAAGITRDLNAAEIVWGRPENFDLSSQADYASKLKAAGYPLPVIARKLGDSPQEIARLRAEMAAEAARAAFATPVGTSGTPDNPPSSPRPSQGRESTPEVSP